MKAARGCSNEVPCPLHRYHVAHLCFCNKCNGSHPGYRVWGHSQLEWDGHLRTVDASIPNHLLDINPKWLTCEGELTLQTNLHVTIEQMAEPAENLKLLAQIMDVKVDGSQDNTTQPGAAAMAAWHMRLALANLKEFMSMHEPSGVIATQIERLGHRAVNTND